MKEESLLVTWIEKKKKLNSGVSCFEFLDLNLKKRTCRKFEANELKDNCCKLSLNLLAINKFEGTDKYVKYSLLVLKNTFNSLECLYLKGIRATDINHKKMVKLIEENTPNLRFFKYGYSKIPECFIIGVYTMMKAKISKNQPLDIQILKFYVYNVQKFDIQKVGYILSLIGVLCDKLLHTQLNKFTTHLLLRFFLTTADFASRKEKMSFISIGDFLLDPIRLFYKYWDIIEFVPLKNNPYNWNSDIMCKDQAFYENIDADRFWTFN